MSNRYEVLIELESPQELQPVGQEFAETLHEHDGVNVYSESDSGARSLSEADLMLSYVIGLASGLTIEAVKAAVQAILKKRGSKAKVEVTDLGDSD